MVHSEWKFGGAGFRVLSEWPRMDLEHDQCFPNVFSILRKACGKSLVHSRSIRRVLKAFGKRSEMKPFEVNMREVFGLFWKHSETILKTFGKQTESIRGENTFGGTFGQFKKSLHFHVRKTNGSSFGPVGCHISRHLDAVETATTSVCVWPWELSNTSRRTARAKLTVVLIKMQTGPQNNFKSA